MFFGLQFSVDQRNGDGEAKSPAGRAGICEAVLYSTEPGTGLLAQVKLCLHNLIYCFLCCVFLVFNLHINVSNSSLL